LLGAGLIVTPDINKRSKRSTPAHYKWRDYHYCCYYYSYVGS